MAGPSSSRISMTDRMSVAIGTAGLELPRATAPVYCEMCELKKGLRHRLNSYQATRSLSCSLWPAHMRKGRSAKPKAYQKPKYKLEPKVAEVFGALADRAPEPSLTSFQTACAAVKETLGLNPVYERHQKGSAEKQQIHVCRLAAATLRWGLGWRPDKIADFMGASMTTVSGWTYTVRYAILDDKEETVANIRRACASLANVFPPPAQAAA